MACMQEYDNSKCGNGAAGSRGQYQARSCLSLRTSYAFWISLKRSSASSSRCWFLSTAESGVRMGGGGGISHDT